MRNAASIGINPLQVWDMTPREFGFCVDAANEKRKDENENLLTQSYLTAYWGRVKKLDSLNKILGKEKKKPADTAEAMLEMVKRLNAAHGGDVIE